MKKKTDTEKPTHVWMSQRDIMPIERLYREHADTIYKIAYKYLRATAAAEDVLQEVFAEILAHPNWLANAKDPSRYLYKVTHNHCVKKFHKLSRDYEATKEYVRTMETADSIEVDEQRMKLSSLVNQLPPMQKKVVQLVTLEGLSYQEAGKKLSISSETVHSHLKRSFRYLRKHFTHISSVFLPFLSFFD